MIGYLTLKKGRYLTMPFIIKLVMSVTFFVSVGLNAAQIQKQFVTTSEMRGWIEVDNQERFFGFVLGVHDAFNQLFFCTKSNVDPDEVVGAVRMFLLERSDTDHKSAADTVRQALTEAYRCGKR